MLDVYIAGCDAVVHLAGEMSGSAPGKSAQRALRAKHPDLADKLPPLGEALQRGAGVSYTQWEAWLALYHGKLLFIARAAETAERGPNYMPSDASRAVQAAHLARLKTMDRHPGCTFASPDNLAKHILSSAVLDLLVKAQLLAYRKRSDARAIWPMGSSTKWRGRSRATKRSISKARNRRCATPSKSMRMRLSGDRRRPISTPSSMRRWREQGAVDKGQSALARATLDKAADDMAREEEARRERYVAGVTALRHRERDIALATYDGDAAAAAILKLARSIHGANTAMVVEFVGKEAHALYEYGRDRGSNVHLVAAIAMRRNRLTLASSDDTRGAAHNDLGIALYVLGARENGTARLEEAIIAYRKALEERTRERVPIEWAVTQMNLGNALATLGDRESGTARLEEAVAAYRAALEQTTRERVPLDWAVTQGNLGNALAMLGRRESGTKKLEEAAATFRAALEEYSRGRAPLHWAAMQNGFGAALRILGERESDAARLEEAVAAYRAALEERTRERVPLDWAQTQNNLGNALRALGERASGTARLEEAVVAYRAALEEWTRERVPLDWAMTQNNLGNALQMLGGLESGTARLDEAMAAYRAALEERTRERVPLVWAQTLRPSVAPAKTMVLHQVLVKMLDREALVALAIKPLHFLRPVAWNPPTGRPAKPAVQEPGLAVLLVTPRPAPECPLRHSEQLGRFLLIELRRFPAVKNVQKHRHAHTLKGFRPAHPDPPKRAGSTGQFVRYLNRTYRLLPTKIRNLVAKNRNACYKLNLSGMTRIWRRPLAPMSQRQGE